MTPLLQRSRSWEMGRRTFVAACLSLLTLGPALAQQPPSPSGEGKLIGRAAIDKLIGNTMSGTAQGSPYFAFYDKDGTVRMQIGGDLQSGKWTIDGDDPIWFEQLAGGRHDQAAPDPLQQPCARLGRVRPSVAGRSA